MSDQRATASEEQKACPFCQQPNISDHAEGAEWYIGCSHCDVGFMEQTRAKAVEKWNHRAPAPPSREWKDSPAVQEARQKIERMTITLGMTCQTLEDMHQWNAAVAAYADAVSQSAAGRSTTTKQEKQT